MYFLNPTGQGDNARTHMEVRCSKDFGKSWPHSYKVTATKNGGYSDLIHVHNKDGRNLLIAWGYNKDPDAATPNRNIQYMHIGTGWCD